ncbi:MAG: PAC2 family protein [Actinomycetota bacterium]|nr:PAC2 family protein [Actinomycetota bacterium]
MTGPTPSELYRWRTGWPAAAPTGRGPVLVVALEGWVDAGLGASAALTDLLGTGPTEIVAEFDGEELIDQRARRPIARLANGVTAELTWPAIRLVSSTDQLGADVYYLTGPEPDFRWRTFTTAVVDIARTIGAQMVVGLGAFPAPAPHTRPVRLASTAPEQSADLARRIGFVQGTIEVPAGIQAVLELAMADAGIPAVGLWARVPHYVAAMPYPEASAALVDGLCALTGLAFDTSSLHEAARASRRQVDELVAGNDEHRDMVSRLERAVDAEEGAPFAFGDEVPSGDEIAAELEKFLRNEDG